MAGPQAVPYMNSRRRPPPTGDEEATSVIKLGELSEASAISVAEANLLLQVIETQRRAHGKEMNNKDIYLKAKDYASLFARFQNKTVEQVERETSASQGMYNLSHFERAQLATLCFDTSEEARTLVPSLEGKLNDDELQRLLDSISKLRDFS